MMCMLLRYILLVAICNIQLQGFLLHNGMRRFSVESKISRNYNIQMSEINRQHIQSQSEYPKSKIKNFIGSAVAGVIFSGIWQRVPNSFADEKLDVECSDSIIILENAPKNRKVVLIGTAHISEESANLVRRVIQNAKPDTVMIELDRKRVGKVSDPKELERNGFILPKESLNINIQNAVDLSGLPLQMSPEPSSVPKESVQTKRSSVFDSVVSKVFNPIKSVLKRTAGSILGKALGQFYSSVEKLGFTAGGEFQAAVEEGRKVGSKILLGDRDVDVTLERLATAIGTVGPNSINQMVEKLSATERELGMDITNESSLNKEELTVFVETLKQKEVINRMMGVIKSELPTVYNALVGERDQFMANSIIDADSSLLVGVVGLAHLAGIERVLTSQGKFLSINRNCPVTE